MELGRKEDFKSVDIHKFVASTMKEEGYSTLNVDSFQSLLDNKL